MHARSIFYKVIFAAVTKQTIICTSVSAVFLHPPVQPFPEAYLKNNRKKREREKKEKNRRERRERYDRELFMQQTLGYRRTFILNDSVSPETL